VLSRRISWLTFLSLLKANLEVANERKEKLKESRKKRKRDRKPLNKGPTTRDTTKKIYDEWDSDEGNTVKLF